MAEIMVDSAILNLKGWVLDRDSQAKHVDRKLFFKKNIGTTLLQKHSRYHNQTSMMVCTAWSTVESSQKIPIWHVYFNKVWLHWTRKKPHSLILIGNLCNNLALLGQLSQTQESVSRCKLNHLKSKMQTS